MGVSGIDTYLNENKKLVTHFHRQSHHMIRVVVDGCALESKIVSNAAKVSLASCCSYEYLYKYTYDFLNWMKSMNICIEQYYDDMMSDMDKVKTDLRRKKGRVNRSAKLIATLNENYEQKTPKNLVEGTGYPRMCHQSVRSAVDAFLRMEKKRRLFACSDPDREIAKYAEMHKCYVLTGDYDFAVFPVNGIVDVRLILNAFDHKSHSIPTIPRHKMLNALHLTNLKLLYTAVLCGNDFGSRGKPACLEDMPKNVKAIDVVMSHVVQLADTKESLIEDCMTQFPGRSREAIEKWLESNIVSNAAKVSLASCCSYEYLYKYTFDFLNWMESTNIQIEQYYDDMMSDMDKVKTDLDRKKKRIDRSIELISTLNEDYEHGSPEGLVDGVGYPRMCIQCVRSAVDAFLRKRGKSRLFACSDPDREIAKYAEMHKCYVLTGDYDFAVFPVNGIVDVLEVFKAFDHKSHSIPTIPRDTMLNALHLTNLKLLYTAVLCGNDFGSRGKPACLEDMPKNVKAIDVVMSHVVQLADTKESLIEDCMTQFPGRSREAIEKWFSFVEFKYNTKAYPLFPQSCLTQSIDDDVFTLCGISKYSLRQLMFRYGTSYSSFLFDYIFLPRVSIPVTLFFQNSDLNDFLLKLNITLYHMIGNDVEDPYVVIKDGGYYEPSKEAVEDRRWMRRRSWSCWHRSIPPSPSRRLK
ncbi:hypothetical protein AV274_4413 [Blastocystis sp. ATCC 50177/Nand II]|uniref:Asteroid domain-containing protein n=1 Tax=Blastocystis sp. subtype 1 (strain ATCC 50177 / NandII) TaxID=478820 RepID=A0A196SD34_BLAHN|nr:hypothetical protein AV274_4413 [Blastocystis sp. ATCC 50177/Nand II]